MRNTERTNRELIERARRNMAYLRRGSHHSKARARNLAFVFKLAITESRLADFRWWKVWRLRQYIRDRKWYAEHVPISAARRADQHDKDGQQ